MKQNDYLKQHEQLHNDETQRFCTRRGENKVFDGRTLGRKFGHKHTLAQVVLEHGPKSVLDYGCGKGNSIIVGRNTGGRFSPHGENMSRYPPFMTPAGSLTKKNPREFLME